MSGDQVRQVSKRQRTMGAMMSPAPMLNMMMNPGAMVNPAALTGFNAAMMMNPAAQIMQPGPAVLAVPQQEHQLVMSHDDDADEDEAAAVPAAGGGNRANSKAAAPAVEVAAGPEEGGTTLPSTSTTGVPGTSVALSVAGQSFKEAFECLSNAKSALYKTTREELKIPRSIAYLRNLPKAWLPVDCLIEQPHTPASFFQILIQAL